MGFQPSFLYFPLYLMSTECQMKDKYPFAHKDTCSNFCFLTLGRIEHHIWLLTPMENNLIMLH